MDKFLDYFSSLLESTPQLTHASKIVASIVKKNKKEKQIKFLPKICNEYKSYIEAQEQLKGWDRNIIEERVKLLNKYYNFYHDNDIDNLFSSQSKLRPSILEEFVFLLFRDYVNDLIDRFDADSIINSGSAKAYTNLFFRAKDFQEFIKAPQIGVNQKDQDYSIYRELSISIDGKNTKIKIPVVAVETKTYIDKTMLDSIIATAEKLKNGTPHSKFIAVTESYEVDKNVDPAYSRIDQIYVLRKSNNRDSWNQISEDVVFRLFNDVKDHIERPWSDIETKMKKEGVIL